MYTKAQSIFQQLIEEFLRAGIPLDRSCIQEELHFSNTLTSLGKCKKTGDLYTIYLSRHAMQDDNQIKNTLAHELIHTLPSCMNHGKRFHYYGNLLEKKLGISIASKASKQESEKSGIQQAYQDKAKYKVVCSDCGYTIYRQKKSALISSPHKYRCGKCRGKLKIYLYK